MKIKNIEGFTAVELQGEVNSGGRFVYFPYTVSLLVVTFRRTSGVYLIRAGENATMRSMPFTLLTLFLGWWGIPFGPKYSYESIRSNLRGGKDVTDDVMATVAGYMLFEETQQKKSGRNNY